MQHRRQHGERRRVSNARTETDFTQTIPHQIHAYPTQLLTNARSRPTNHICEQKKSTRCGDIHMREPKGCRCRATALPATPSSAIEIAGARGDACVKRDLSAAAAQSLCLGGPRCVGGQHALQYGGCISAPGFRSFSHLLDQL